MERQLTEWEIIFANDETDKRLIYKIHRQLIQLNNNKKKIEKWAEYLNRLFFKEDI